MNGLTKVKPGDLITADFINGLIDNITNLNQRIKTLEDGFSEAGDVRITAFKPPPPPYDNGQNLGQVLQIFGDNFSWPPQNNTVTIQNFLVPIGGKATVTKFQPGSNPTMLEFVIPTTIAGVQASGTDVTITVGSSAPKTYHLRPALPTSGKPPFFISDKPITNKLDGSVNLSVNKTAIIKGGNFGSTVSDNKIELVIPTGTGEKRYPIVPSLASTTEIEFIVPDISEITDEGIDVSVELKVDNYPPLEYVVFISRD